MMPKDEDCPHCDNGVVHGFGRLEYCPHCNGTGIASNGWWQLSGLIAYILVIAFVIWVLWNLWGVQR
jgi:hypothetical protein